MSWATVLLAAPGLTNAGIQIVREVKSQRQAREAAVRRAPSSTRSRNSAASRPGRVSGLPSFSKEQMEALGVIAREVKRYGALSPELSLSRDALILGLWVNAWQESRLREEAYNGRGESSVGLFQINIRAHPGHTREALARGEYNTRVMLGLIQRDHRRFDDILRRGADIATITAAITLWIERPKAREQKALERAEILASWFPSLANQRALGWVFR